MLDQVKPHVFIKCHANEGDLAGEMYVLHLDIEAETVTVNYPVNELDQATNWFASDKYPTTKDWIKSQLHYIAKDYKDYLLKNKKPSLLEIFEKCYVNNNIKYDKDLPIP